MSDLTVRLRAILAERRPSASGRTPVAVPSGSPVDPDRIAAALGGAVVATALGPCAVIDRLYASADRHGAVAVGELAELDPAALGLLAGSRSAPPPPGAVTFFDLETTGLSGGAGSCAFLVGCGSFVPGGFLTRQFFLLGFAHEPALLTATAGCLDEAAVLVTFNGKSFDVPMMENRWAFHRMAATLDEALHLDMLHPARRLWRRDAGGTDASLWATPETEARSSCSLGTLERDLLGVVRTGDPGGFEIPSLYFDYVRTGDPAGLRAVLEHNRLDLLSLAGLTARAARLVARGPGDALTPRECLGLGRLYEKGGRAELAVECYARAVAGPGAGRDGAKPVDLGTRVVDDGDVKAEALRRLARAQRRQRRFTEAARSWQQLLHLDRAPVSARLEAMEALAVHHEHRTKDLEVARTLAEAAMRSRQPQGHQRRLAYRIARLDRKLVGRSEDTVLPLGTREPDSR